MPNPRKTDRKQSREALKPRMMFRDEDGSIHHDDCPTYRSRPVLVLDWSHAGQEWLVEVMRKVFVAQANKKFFSYDGTACAILRRMEALAKGGGK